MERTFFLFGVLPSKYSGGAAGLRFGPGEGGIPPAPSAAPSLGQNDFLAAISICVAELIITILADIFCKVNSATHTTVSRWKKSKLLNVGTGSIYRLIG